MRRSFVMMNLTSPSQVRAFLAEHEIRPNRVLGQNFLVDRNILESIIEAAELGCDDDVLEIGPGLGVVTEFLMANAAHVTAMEKDGCLFGVLQRRWASEASLNLLHGDFLRADISEFLSHGKFTRMVSNLPYSVGTRILMELGIVAEPIPLMVVMVQFEVGERLAASEGNEKRGLVSVWMQRRYDVEVMRKVSRNCFWPRPDIGSAVVRMRRHSRHELPDAVESRFREVTKHAFSQRRKQLSGIIYRTREEWRLPLPEAQALIADICGDERVRPSDLSVAQWCELAARLTP